MTDAKWSGKTEGNLLGYRIFIYTIKFFGLSGAYFILKFVSFYFYLSLTLKRRILTDFYSNFIGLPKSKTHSTIRKNFFLLGQSVVDNIAFSINRSSKITYRESGEIFLKQLVSDKKGAFLISGHIGNWDVAGNLLRGIKANVSVVMYQNEHEKIQALLASQKKQAEFNIIPIGNDMSHLIKIHAAIKRGDLVCLHADRYLEGAKTERINFLGKPAKFPIGPFQLIEKMKVPYSFVFAVKESKYQYFFSATKPVFEPRKASAIAHDFVILLEQKARKNPEQWFNYYNFHDKS